MPRVNPKPLWEFAPEDDGSIMATPCVMPHGTVVAVAHKEGFSSFGRVYCLDPNSGKSRWVFGGAERMKWVFCSPVYADGRIFVGEGLHENEDCRIFCIDAETGKKLWQTW